MSKVIRISNTNEMLLNEYRKIFKIIYGETTLLLNNQQIITMCLKAGIKELENKIGGK